MDDDSHALQQPPLVGEAIAAAYSGENQHAWRSEDDRGTACSRHCETCPCCVQLGTVGWKALGLQPLRHLHMYFLAFLNLLALILCVCALRSNANSPTAVMSAPWLSLSVIVSPTQTTTVSSTSSTLAQLPSNASNFTSTTSTTITTFSTSSTNTSISTNASMLGIASSIASGSSALNVPSTSVSSSSTMSPLSPAPDNNQTALTATATTSTGGTTPSTASTYESSPEFWKLQGRRLRQRSYTATIGVSGYVVVFIDSPDHDGHMVTWDSLSCRDFFAAAQCTRCRSAFSTSFLLAVGTLVAHLASLAVAVKRSQCESDRNNLKVIGMVAPLMAFIQNLLSVSQLRDECFDSLANDLAFGLGIRCIEYSHKICPLLIAIHLIMPVPWEYTCKLRKPDVPDQFQDRATPNRLREPANFVHSQETVRPEKRVELTTQREERHRSLSEPCFGSASLSRLAVVRLEVRHPQDTVRRLRTAHVSAATEIELSETSSLGARASVDLQEQDTPAIQSALNALSQQLGGDIVAGQLDACEDWPTREMSQRRSSSLECFSPSSQIWNQLASKSRNNDDAINAYLERDPVTDQGQNRPMDFSDQKRHEIP